MSSQGDRESKILLKNAILKLEIRKFDISLLLNLFQRQALKAKIDKMEWVTNLLGLLPVEVAEIILGEPADYPMISIT